MKTTILGPLGPPYVDRVAHITVELYRVLVKHELPCNLLALTLTLDCVLGQIAEGPGCPPEAAAEANQIRRKLRKLMRDSALAIARSHDQRQAEP